VTMQGALDGIRVLDLTNHLSGPYCGMLLGDLGADVIKIERPGEGDEARHMPPFIKGEGSPFMLWNRNKRSIVLDLKSEGGRKAIHALARDADILLENFRPGTLDRLGIGYGALRATNPKLIYCAISGFGQTGPYRNRGGFDLMTQGMSGLMAVCGPEDGAPFRLPIAISDVAAGCYATIGILAALEARHRTGTGQMVETSLLDSAVSFGLYEAAHFFATGERPPRLGQAHRGNAPYQVFKTKDGWITIGGAQQNFWTRLCNVLGLTELADDPRFRTNALRVQNNKELVALLQERVETQTAAHWLNELEVAGVPSGPVLTHDEVFTDPQILAREMVQEIEHPAAGLIRTLGNPIKMSRTKPAIRRPAPLLGEHTAEILAEIDRGDRRGQPRDEKPD
jgi:crotonobetainyl-CoA:carnitine CoA-transferase CaiB-like acyl-CoA transferase